MPISDEDPAPPYNERIAILPGDPPIAYRPRVYLVNERAPEEIREMGTPLFPPREGTDGDDLPPFGQWYRIEDEPDPTARVRELGVRRAQLDVVYFANGADCCGCPPHPALATAFAANPWSANPWSANPWSANPWSANPWSANPWSANPWSANPWSANPWSANSVSVNLAATRTPPTTSVLPAPARSLPDRPRHPHGEQPNGVDVVIYDTGLAGGTARPELLGRDPASLARISGDLDVPSRPIGSGPPDEYLDPVAGHGTFIAGIIEQLTPGCTMRLPRVIHPEGDVSVSMLAQDLWNMMWPVVPALVNLSLSGTGRVRPLEHLIEHYHHEHGVVFVGAAGNEGSCVEQYPAAMRSVIGVAAMGPTGPAPWSNYGRWVDACAPGTDIVSAFFAEFNGGMPRINGMDPDDFDEWATWSGTSFAAPVVVAALAREMVTTSCTAVQAAERVVHAQHLARLPNMGTIVNF